MSNETEEQMKRAATVLRLDYDTEDHPGRREHTVVFVSTDFEELTGLLTFPSETLRYLETRWKQTPSPDAPTGGGPVDRPEKHVDWVLRPPASARIECALSLVAYGSGKARFANLGAILTMLDALATLRPAAANSFGEAHRRREVSNSAATSSPLVDAFLEKYSELLPMGGFVAEFAPHTSSLYVSYFPTPDSVSAVSGSLANPSAAVDEGRFGGKLTVATLNLLQKIRYGTVHFDIGTGARERAQFLVDHIENPCRTCVKLNTDNGKRIFIGGTDLVAEGGKILLTGLKEETRGKDFMVDSGYGAEDQSRTRSSAIYWEIFPEGRPPESHAAAAHSAILANVYPRVFVEELGMEESTCICAMGTVQEEPDRYVLGDLTLKAYVCPPPPPPPPGPVSGGRPTKSDRTEA